MRDIDWLIIHHIGDVPKGFNYAKTVETVRGWHKAKGWSDIGYNKVILPNGDIKQGRPDAVIGAHAYGANAPSLGILVAGDFRTKAPPDAQFESLVDACIILRSRHAIPLDHIIGHRDVARLFPGGAASDCPGDALYALLPKLRERVKVGK